MVPTLRRWHVRALLNTIFSRSLMVGVVVVAIASAGAARPVADAAVRTRQQTVQQQLSGLRLVNYFPEAHSWDGMWTSWQPQVLAKDFARIEALHANAVRITVFPSAFGYPLPSQLMQSRLAKVVELAQANGLKVQLSLFDQFTQWRDIAGSETWARTLLARYLNDPRIAFVDLRNELDPNNTDQITWARQLLPVVKSAVGQVPVTVSKSGGGAAEAFCQLKQDLAPVVPDFWDWHYYGVEGLAYPLMAQVKACAAPQQLYIGETGASAYSDGQVNGLVASDASYEAYQAYYLDVIETAAAQLHLPPVAPWMLTDIDPNGAPPQPSPTAYHYGLYRADGTARASASVIDKYFAGLTPGLSVDYGFEHRVSDSSGTLPALWRRSNTADVNFAWDGTLAHTGRASVEVGPSGGTSSAGAGLWTVPVNAHVTAGATVTSSVWAQGSSATGDNRLSMSFFDSTGTYCGQIESRPLPSGTTTWTNLVATGSVPACAGYVRLYLKSSGNTGRVWFDDVAYEGN